MKWEDLDLEIDEDPEKERNERRKTILFWIVAIMSHGFVMYLWISNYDFIKEFIYGRQRLSVEYREPEIKQPSHPAQPTVLNKPQAVPKSTTPRLEAVNPRTVPFPGTMLVVDSGYQGACPLIFDARDIQLDSVITLFNNKTGERAAWGYLQGGISATIRLLPGEYDVVTISGEEWFGRVEMFGDKDVPRRTKSPLVFKASQEKCPERVIQMRKFIASGKL
jgi:hypothetical protein